MIIDINEIGPDPTISADICIIGSGAAGIAMAREFIGSPFSVLLLEGGGAAFETTSQEPYQSEVMGLRHGGIHEGRARVLGGTTTLWAGQALPLHEIDFQKRDWVAHSGWPIERSILLPYYRRAEDVMQIPHATYDPQTWPKCKGDPPAYDPTKLITYYSQFTSTPNFSHKYRAQLEAAANIKIITHANVISLEANGDATAIREVVARSLEGKTLKVTARMFVVCCGGIETARLLLVSNSVEKQGIGNRYDVVGRYFQDHPGLRVPIRPRHKRRFGKWYNAFRKDSIQYAIKIAASDSLQRQHATLSSGAEVYYPSMDDDPINAAKQVLRALRDPHRRKDVPHALARIARRPDRVAAAAYRHFILRQPANVGSSQPYLGIGCEQAPNPDSRVMLSSDLDNLGIRRTALDWRLTEAETYSIGILLQAIAQEWNRMDIADLDMTGFQLAGRERGENGGYVDSNHHIGTTRMGIDLKTSVVDADCRVHGYHNLYIGSSSVFPTGGFSNPTLTILALCLRLSDTLKEQLP